MTMKTQDKEKTDIYLLQDSSDQKYVALLTDGSTAAGISQFFSSTGLPPTTSSNSTSTFPRMTSTTVSNPSTASTTNPLMESTTSSTSARSSVNTNNVSAKTGNTSTASQSIPVNNTTTRAQTQATTSASVARSGPHIFDTTIRKGEHGIGLDIGKTKDGAAVVLKLKEMPNNAINPASQCNPPIAVRDVILAVNGQSAPQFADAVRLIRATDVNVTLTIQRS